VKAESIVPQVSVEPEVEYVPHGAEVYTAPIEINPPENFVVAPTCENEADLKPHVLAKQKLFKDLGIFQHVDSHVLEVNTTNRSMMFRIFC
jgi:hypothetical protein